MVCQDHFFEKKAVCKEKAKSVISYSIFCNIEMGKYSLFLQKTHQNFFPVYAKILLYRLKNQKTVLTDPACNVTMIQKCTYICGAADAKRARAPLFGRTGAGA